MKQSEVRCEKCGQYVNYKEWAKGHECGVKQLKEDDLGNLNHKEVLDYYQLHPEKIEEGMTIVFRELGIFKGRIDLVARDKNQRLCLIELINKEHKGKKEDRKKLQRYAYSLKTIGERIFLLKSEEINFRLLIIRTNKGIEEV